MEKKKGKDGKWYFKKQCDVCNKDIWRLKRYYNTKSYCSNKCKSVGQTTKIEVTCDFCGKKFLKAKSYIKRTNGNYCNKSCAAYKKAENMSGSEHPNFTNGKSSYRARGLKEHGVKCQNPKCPFESIDERMLDVHHINGNREINTKDNLIVLCVYCHALITRGLITLEDMVGLVH